MKTCMVNFRKLLKPNQLLQNIATLPPPPHLVQAKPSIDDLKSTLMEKLLAEGTTEDTDLVKILIRQADAQAQA